MRYLATLAMLALINTAQAAPSSKISIGADGTINMPEITIEGHLPGKETGKGSPRVGCGADCRDGVKLTPKNTGIPPVLTSPAAKSAADILAAAEKEFNDAAKEHAWNLEQDEQPLGGDSLVVKWAVDKLKGAVLGPVDKLIDALEPTPTGQTDFDRAKTKEGMQNLRQHLEHEEQQMKTQRDTDKKAYEENMKLLFPEVPQELLNRGPASEGDKARRARFEKSIVALAKIKSDDFGAVAEQILRRSRPDAEFRLSTASITEAGKLFDFMAPANMCAIDATRGCMLQGVKKGGQCYCPVYVNQFNWQAIPGQAYRRETSQFCRVGSVKENIYEAVPIGVTCRVPVDVTINPSFPQVEYIPGRIVK